MPTTHFEYRFECLHKALQEKVVIKDARLTVRQSQCTVLVGENGSGKTTLLKILAGLAKPDSGCVRINTEKLTLSRAKRFLLQHFMYLHQQPYMLDATVEKNLRFVRRDSAAIQEAIEWAGLEKLVKKDANKLSGGEKQRVALARAHLRNPQTVLLDEPTANLDRLSKTRTLQLLQRLKGEGVAMVIATHDPEIFLSIQDERLKLENGKLSNFKKKKKNNATAPMHWVGQNTPNNMGRTSACQYGGRLK